MSLHRQLILIAVSFPGCYQPELIKLGLECIALEKQVRAADDGYFYIDQLLFCAILLRIWSKIFLSNGPFLTFFFQPDVCQLRSRQHRQYVHVTEHEFFSPNCSKFAVECDWNSMISQNVQNLGFFWKKNRWVFRKKLWIFFSKLIKVANLLQNAYQMVLFRKNVFSALIVRFFGKNFRKLWKLEKLENKIVFFHLLIGLLHKKGKAQNMPVVAGCFVLYSSWCKKWGENGKKQIKAAEKVGIHLVALFCRRNIIISFQSECNHFQFCCLKLRKYTESQTLFFEFLMSKTLNINFESKTSQVEESIERDWLNDFVLNAIYQNSFNFSLFGKSAANQKSRFSHRMRKLYNFNFKVS